MKTCPTVAELAASKLRVKCSYETVRAVWLAETSEGLAAALPEAAAFTKYLEAHRTFEDAQRVILSDVTGLEIRLYGWLGDEVYAFATRSRANVPTIVLIGNALHVMKGSEMPHRQNRSTEVQTMTPDIQTKIRLAKAFGTLIQEALTRHQFNTVLDRNKSESDDGVCHSHDFCDANMYMLEAFEAELGRKPSFLDGTDDAAENLDLAVWNDAWAIAKAADFFC
ncbi:hypothetical protein GOD54_23480 [Sinorhizobium medicae]|nr:hypothetical protein [Sinorhizobium medicae]